MEFFIDTADVNEIREGMDLGMVDGVTTNPSLVAKTGRKFEEVLEEICTLTPGPVSAEVTALEAEPMVEQARQLTKIASNIVVKVPLTIEGLKATRRLSDEEIQTNVTRCFSPAQALLAAKAGATYVSPFVGRLDDLGTEGMQLIEQILTIYDNYIYETKVLVASARNPKHVTEAALLGADVVTMPFAVMKKLAGHPLTDIGLDQFMADWKKVQGS